MAKYRNTATEIGIRWTIENVSRIKLESEIIGPDFYLSPECAIRISFKKCEVYIYVYLAIKSNTKLRVDKKIALFDYNGKKLHENKKDVKYDLIGALRKKELEKLTMNLLIIDLFLSIKEVETKEFNHLIYLKSPKRKLREDFKMMLENPVNSDISLQVDNERIPAHWSILCSRSPYFRKIFDSGMQERVQNSIIITDLSLDRLKELIHFLYTGDFVHGDDIQELFDLYYASDKYEVMDLKTLCGHEIISNATADNVVEILQFSYRHDDTAMKMEVMDFIYLQSDAVFQKEGWKKFKASELALAELIYIFYRKKK